MNELFVEFKQETKALLDQAKNILEMVEDDFHKCKELIVYGQLMDQVATRVRTISVKYNNSILVATGGCAEICKIVGYKGSRLSNENFYAVVVGFLLDATETLLEMNQALGEEERKASDFLHETFIERLRLVDSQFNENMKETLSVGGRGQSDSSGEDTNRDEIEEAKDSQEQATIDDILKRLES